MSKSFLKIIHKKTPESKSLKLWTCDLQFYWKRDSDTGAFLKPLQCIFSVITKEGSL